jgi:hypothetical protein
VGEHVKPSVLDREALKSILDELQTGNVDAALRLVDDSFWP